MRLSSTNSYIAAPAKINLSLEIIGRRSDGYHELSSLVAFSEFADEIEYGAAASQTLIVTGEFAGALDGENLIEKASQILKNKHPEIALGAVELCKNIPVAAGLGGGSSDVAAYLNLIKGQYGGIISTEDVTELAAMLGADVPVCLQGAPCLMQGVGDLLTPIKIASQLQIVLVNCGAKLSTKAVFDQLNTPQIHLTELQQERLIGMQTVLKEDLATFEGLIRFLDLHPNDLTPAALTLEPQIGVCLKQLGELDGCALARMSGSGATCFGLFKEAEAAEAGARGIKQLHPNWWVKKSRLLPTPPNS